MKTSIEKEIDDLYEKIMKAIVGGKIYGIPVKDNDIKLLIVSAYFLGINGDLDERANIEDEDYV